MIGFRARRSPGALETLILQILQTVQHFLYIFIDFYRFLQTLQHFCKSDYSTHLISFSVLCFSMSDSQKRVLCFFGVWLLKPFGCLASRARCPQSGQCSRTYIFHINIPIRIINLGCLASRALFPQVWTGSLFYSLWLIV